MSITDSNIGFSGATWFPQGDEPVLIGGCGGIGSWLTFFLARAGFKVTVTDYDKVEETNLGGQLFRESDLGSYKVFAMQITTKEFCGAEINALTNRIDENSMGHHFMFSAFDNMQARKDAFNSWKRASENCSVTPIFIDGRLEFEQLQIFCVTPENMDEYELEHLFDDSEVEDAACSMKQSSHVAAMIASKMMAFFTNHMVNIYEREVIRTVPFFYEYFIPVNLTVDGAINI